MNRTGSEKDFFPSGVNDISPTAFSVLNWIFFALCIVAFGIRAYIRHVCFGRLLVEDYMVLLALTMHSVEAVLIQVYARYAFDLVAVQRGDVSSMAPDLLENSERMFHALGASVNLSMAGLLLVKLNFLLFFRRLGRHVCGFHLLWWAVLLFTVAGAAVQFGIIRYGCFYGSVDWILYSGNCTDAAALRVTMIASIFSAAQDAVSDVFIVTLPVTILWRSRISLRKKLTLTLIFCLVFLIIAITIVRGSVFHSLYSEAAKGHEAQQSATFTWFWFYCEFSVAIIIACIVSFRTLFVQRDDKAKNLLREQEQQRQHHHHRAARQGAFRKFHDSVLHTCMTLEGCHLPDTPSGDMTVDFNDDTNWTKNINKIHAENSISPQSRSMEQPSQ